MCGIVGIIARKGVGFFQGDMDLMQNLLLLDQIRGDDSTGVFSVFRDRSVTLTKIGSHPAHLFSTKEWEKLRGKTATNGRMMIGHNRKATMGSVNSANAHPFHENNIVLVHNGTLRGGHKKLADTEVDSHAVCHAFNELGAEKVIPTLDAAFAFVWWDISKSKLFAVRNEERPLSLVVTEDLNILCSEPWMAVGLLARANKKVETVIDIKPGEVFEFALDGTYTTHKVELKKLISTGYSYTGMSRSHYSSDYWDDMEDANVVGTTHPKGCGGTTPTPFESAAERIITNANFTENKEYHRADTILIRVTNLHYSIAQAQCRVTGLVIEPGKTAMEFAGFLPAGLSKEERDSFIGKDCIATCTGVTNSTCGPSMWVSNIRISPMVKLHNTDLPERAWSYVTANVSCKDCNKHVYYVDSLFTSASKRPDGWRVTCGDCIEDKLTGAVKDEFAKRRLDAIQDELREQQTSTSRAVSLVKSDSSPTLH